MRQEEDSPSKENRPRYSGRLEGGSFAMMTERKRVCSEYFYGGLWLKGSPAR